MRATDTQVRGRDRVPARADVTTRDANDTGYSKHIP